MLWSIGLRAQTPRIAQLRQALKYAVTPASRLDAVLQLCEESYSMSNDTLLAYAERIGPLATAAGKPEKKIYQPYYQAVSLTNKGEADSALQICTEILPSVSYEGAERDIYVKFIRLKGRLLIRKREFKEALDLYYSLLADAEKDNDISLQAAVRNSIGWVHMEMTQYPEALQWFYGALPGFGKGGVEDKWESVACSNLASVWNEMGRYDSAIYYINRSLELNRRYQMLAYLANAYAIQSAIYINIKNNEGAETSLNQALEIRKQIGDPFYIVSDMAQLAMYYASNGQAEKGIRISEEGIRLARQYQLSSKLIFLYTALAESNKKAGNTGSYMSALEKLLDLKDSIYQANTATALAGMQARYEVQKKENTIMQQTLSLTRKNYIIYGAYLLSLLIILFSALLFRSNKKRQALRIRQQKEEDERLAQEAIQKAEENERKRIAANLHNSLGAYAASISSNLDEISRYPVAAPVKTAMDELSSNSQAIVAELIDTIWALKKETITLSATSDRVKGFINRIQPTYPGVDIQVSEHIDQDTELPSSQAFHLFQVIQQAVTAILENTFSNRVGILIESRQGWTVRIYNNGGAVAGRAAKTGQDIADNSWHVRYMPGEMIISSTIN